MKVAITTNIKSTTGFPTSYRWSAYITPKSNMGGSKSAFFKICIQQLGRVEEIDWLPYDAGLSVAVETLVGILKRVIFTPAVYPRFFNFFTLTFRALSRPWSRQSNDVMSEIVCAQLHKLLHRRHSRLQLHGLFALAKHLLCLCSLFSEDTEVENILGVTPKAADEESFILDTATTGHSLTFNFHFALGPVSSCRPTWLSLLSLLGPKSNLQILHMT